MTSQGGGTTEDENGWTGLALLIVMLVVAAALWQGATWAWSNPLAAVAVGRGPRS
ncbi:hypothetical protein ACFVXG_22235 [Kitasatospora sp. NPDC058162]|uniref:hypothetical protein n=1 Tax=Kitasatospora sp. NPDC058162 TaxID=3346362 RepID=UPI0036D803E3